MRLLITDEVRNELPFDVVLMTSLEFNNVSSHPYIVSSRFDEVIVDLDAKVNLGYLRLLLGVTKVIPRLHKELDFQSVGILSEIYPERAAELRVLFIRDKVGFSNLIEELKTTFRWEEFYQEV